MEEKETTTKDSTEYLLESILRRKHGRNTSLIDAPIADSRVARRGGPSNTRIHPYQSTRIARRYYQPRNSNSRR